MLKKRIWAKKSFHNSSLCLATVVLVLASGLARATDDKCDAICGDFDEEKDAMKKILGHMTTTPKPKDSAMSSRIVNGYMPKERPFMALIFNYIDRDDDTKAMCGGSIINNQFILTAGHCVCMADESGDPVENWEHVHCTLENVPQYDFKKNVKVYIGLASAFNIKDTKKRRLAEHDIKAIIAYPTWKAGTGMQDEDGADLALIQLAKKLKWSKMIKPICLPKVEKLKVPENKAYVAGWGNTEMDDQAKGTDAGNCKTDNRGPSRNMKCRFPFKFLDADDVELEECQTHVFPSDENPKCQQFHNFHKNNFDWGETSHVKIMYNRGKDHTECFPPSSFGWCGVCLQHDKPGEEGYCNHLMVGNDATQNRDVEDPFVDDIDEEEIEKEATIVGTGTKWGYCSPECSKSASDLEESGKHLLETTQTIFDNNQCQQLFDSIGSGEAVKKTEVCAGLKFDFPKKKIYQRKFVKKFNATQNVYKFVFEKEEVDHLGQSEEIIKLGFYIGYSDSCEGDSGGPLYQFVGGKAFQRGVVSRGADHQGGCANNNAPGIYTQVYNFIDWIVKNAKSGTC